MRDWKYIGNSKSTKLFIRARKWDRNSYTSSSHPGISSGWKPINRSHETLSKGFMNIK